MRKHVKRFVFNKRKRFYCVRSRIKSFSIVVGRFTSFSPEIEFLPSRFIHHLKTVFYTLRKSLQITSASPYRTQVQPEASFLVCFLIFI
ncbi:DNA or RNA helicases of superfamily II [Streptococcus pneumoniae]|nr:DNA or RNA helicases of superfamily II [Streptococcus pneumoniae]